MLINRVLFGHQKYQSQVHRVGCLLLDNYMLSALVYLRISSQVKVMSGFHSEIQHIRTTVS